MSKKSANKAFIDKIKTLTIGTGAKDTKCGKCGKPMGQHMKLLGMVAIPLSALGEPPKPKKAEQPKHEEQSFAA